MYPYFAFEAPVYRNKIAHNGLWDSGDVKNFANELIYDLFAIISAIKTSNKLPYNVLGVFLPLREVLNTLDIPEGDYGTVITCLFSGIQGVNGGEKIF